MKYIVLRGLLIPFLGTSLGAACVFLMKNQLNQRLQKILTGFAAGVMVAASVWSLLIPSINMSSVDEVSSCFPAAAGFCAGMIFLLILDSLVPHMHMDESVEGHKSDWKKTTMMVFAVVLHNIPEGMAVGIVYASWLSGNSGISATAALALALGIAIQNFPEGAIISMPLKANGVSKGKAFLYGILSGAVEPVAGFLTIILSAYIIVALPYLLSFAAGAMVYVVVEELIPEMAEGKHSNIGTIAFTAGFVLMMVLDIKLG